MTPAMSPFSFRTALLSGALLSLAACGTRDASDPFAPTGAFGRVRFISRPGQRPTLNRSTALTLALATRATLRNSLRAAPDALDAEKNRLTHLRHRMLGKLNQFGSAVNVSAAYGSAEAPELRIVVAMKPGSVEERNEVRTQFSGAAESINGLIESTGYRVDLPKIPFEYGAAHKADLVAWLNTLAGATP